MRVNMSVLADWLSQYTIQRDIKHGINPIQGMRFFMGDLPEIQREFVYVGRAIDVFADQKLRDSVLLLNEYDIIFVHGETMETVINSLLACMDSYGAWELKLKEMALKPNCLQRIVESIAQVFHAHTAVLDMKGKVRALGHPEGAVHDEYIAQSIAETSAIPQSILYAPFTNEKEEQMKDLTEQPELYHSDERWRIIGNYLTIDHERVGTIIIHEWEKPLTQGDCAIVNQLVPTLCQAISSDGVPDIQSTATLFQALLQGDHQSGTAKVLTQRLQEKECRNPWVLFLFRCMGNGYRVGTGRLCEILQNLPQTGTAAISGEDVLALVSERQCNAFLTSATENIWLDQFMVGVSLPFSDLPELHNACRQAEFAMQYQQEAGVRFARDLAFSFLINRMKENTQELSLRHPAKTILGSYDGEKGSELYKTLIVYLENERNMTNAAKSLYIHRNTLTARIDRIQQLLGSTLDNPEERMFILLSEKF